MVKLNKKISLEKISVDTDIPCWLQGLVPEAKAYGVFLLWKKLKSPCFCLLSQEKKAKDLYQNLKIFLPKNTFLLPIRNKTSKRGNTYQLLHNLKNEKTPVLISSVKAALQLVPPIEVIESNNICIEKNKEIERDTLIKWLIKKGYYSVPLVEENGEYAIRGNIVDFYCPLSNYPIRVEFFADKVESIREFDSATQRSIKQLEKFVLSPLNQLDSVPKTCLRAFIQSVSNDYYFILDEPLEIERKLIELGGEKNQKKIAQRATFYISTLPQNVTWAKPKRKLFFNTSLLSFYRGDVNLLSKDIKNWQNQGYNITIITATYSQAKRLQEILREKELEFIFKESFDCRKQKEPLIIILGNNKGGFIFEESKNVIISDADIFRKHRQRKRKSSLFEKKIKNWGELKEDDYVVHMDYGIGKFKKLISLKVMNQWGDYFQVDYKGSDRLYVPFNQLDRVHKYVGDPDNPPPLYNLEGAGWETTKQRIKKAAKDLASSLLKLYSVRKAKPGYSFSLDAPWQLEFEACFPYEETPDQLTATYQTKQDMESSTIMDRLICGDSGYGKTEVAIRASFKAVMDNKQVAVLVPTTILAEQHLRTFSERMADYPIRIGVLSRFQSPKQQQKIIKDLKKGTMDIIIGTHRLFQNDIDFKDLGLLIIDEEHKFGVNQKKRLKEKRKTVDLLTLSATPIPRSLYMALTGVYKLSTIFSPPQERQNIEIKVLPYEDEIVEKAILQELSRKGQVFYLYNRVKSIHKITDRLRKILPQAKITVAHGQVSSARLEKTIINFVNGKYDVLVCTSIIESGIDMPNVNTLIVENSEQFGLADLYQLRGRIGRGKKKGYAYFLFNPIKTLTDQAKRRLQIIHQFKGPGTGFKIAMEDLQIRGAGNLLGKEQHGHIASIGFTLYSQLLSEEIKKIKGEVVKPSFPFNMELGIEARIPSSFVPNKTQRLQLYQKIGAIENEKKLLDFKEELIDRFGPLSVPVNNLIHLLYLKLLAKDIGICSISRNYQAKIRINFSPFHPLTSEKKEKLKLKFDNQIKTFPYDEKNLLISKLDEKSDKELLIWLRKFLQKLKDVLI